MKDSIRAKLESVSERFEEIAGLLADPDVISNQDQFRNLSKEYARVEPVVKLFNEFQSLSKEISSTEEMLNDADPDIREMGEDELGPLSERRESLILELQKSLIPPDPHDDANVFLEIRAGTGGDEAAIFAGDLFRMYSRYAKLKFESGAHRVQRVPATESQGRIHTSACTVAVLPEPDEVEAIEINPSDLRVDTYRASGAGGQHVNKTDSAVRLTHLPSGIVVECQDERSQHKNRARAMSLLQARLLDTQVAAQEAEHAEKRRLLVGSGDRSERIRTYNYPQGRVTDHRINLTLYKLDEIIEGDLDQVIDPLTNEYQADQLAALGA